MWEVVALEAKWADPDLGGEVYAAEGVEKGDAGLATKRRVGERGDVRMRSDRRNRSGDWDHALAGLHLGPGPDVPGHPNSIDALLICAHLRHLSFLSVSVFSFFFLVFSF